MVFIRKMQYLRDSNHNWVNILRFWLDSIITLNPMNYKILGFHLIKAKVSYSTARELYNSRPESVGNSMLTMLRIAS